MAFWMPLPDGWGAYECGVRSAECGVVFRRDLARSVSCAGHRNHSALRTPHSALMRILLVNWQDRENPQGGGAEIHLHEIFGRLAEMDLVEMDLGAEIH